MVLLPVQGGSFMDNMTQEMNVFDQKHNFRTTKKKKTQEGDIISILI